MAARVEALRGPVEVYGAELFDVAHLRDFHSRRATDVARHVDWTGIYQSLDASWIRRNDANDANTLPEKTSGSDISPTWNGALDRVF